LPSAHRVITLFSANVSAIPVTMPPDTLASVDAALLNPYPYPSAHRVAAARRRWSGAWRRNRVGSSVRLKGLRSECPMVIISMRILRYIAFVIAVLWIFSILLAAHYCVINGCSGANGNNIDGFLPAVALAPFGAPALIWSLVILLRWAWRKSSNVSKKS
jgi:hypothetical protein